MIDFPIEKILTETEKFGITLTEKQITNLNTYANLLVSWNEKMNLTAITEPEEVVWKHFYDCMLFFKYVNVPRNAKIIDVGTGAGFPGMVLKIVREDIELTLLDGLNKRLVFLKEVLDSLGLSANVVHLRAEEGGKKVELREQYDFAVARAVANMNLLSEYCLPYVKKGGSFVALKGPTGNEEANNAKKAPITVTTMKAICRFTKKYKKSVCRSCFIQEPTVPTAPIYCIAVRYWKTWRLKDWMPLPGRFLI